MIELKVINKTDPLKRTAEKQSMEEEFSPMNPPDAFAPPNLEEVAYKDMHPFIQKLMDEHKVFIDKLDSFESTLLELQNKGVKKEVLSKLSEFFEYFDQEIHIHNRREERSIFPILHERLKASGEHGKGVDLVTAIDMMEDDHIKAMQLAAVVFNFFGVATKLPDQNSGLILLDMAIEQGKVLIELLRLHIFREDHIVFALAQQHLSKAEMDQFV